MAATFGPSEARAWIATPGPDDDKYSRGVLGFVTGSPRYPGAAVLGVDAALHAGVGMVRYLGERARREGLGNVIPVEALADDANLPETADLALVVDTYHHIGHRIAYFSKLKAVLKPGARLAIVDFKADSPNGPPAAYRIPPERVVEELGAAGYELVETHPFLPRQYFLVFRARAS